MWERIHAEPNSRVVEREMTKLCFGGEIELSKVKYPEGRSSYSNKKEGGRWECQLEIEICLKQQHACMSEKLYRVNWVGLPLLAGEKSTRFFFVEE